MVVCGKNVTLELNLLPTAPEKSQPFITKGAFENTVHGCFGFDGWALKMAGGERGGRGGRESESEREREAG